MSSFRRLYHTSLALVDAPCLPTGSSKGSYNLQNPLRLLEKLGGTKCTIRREVWTISCHLMAPLFTLQRERYVSRAHGMLGFSAGKAGEKVPKRIMIVDDGQEVRQVIRAIFEARTDYEICGEASNGAEAIEKALALKPDLLLLDVAMPMLNGVEAASVLAGSLPKMPIVLYTMYNELLGLSLATAVGAKAVISKADGISRLLECVHDLLEPKAQPDPEAPGPVPSDAAPVKPPVNHE
jgi:CheY-like chemotaxis protein